MGSRKVIWSGSRSSSFVLTLFIFKRIFFLSFLFFLFLSCECAFDLLRDDLYHSVYLICTTFPSRPKGVTQKLPYITCCTHPLVQPFARARCSDLKLSFREVRHRGTRMGFWKNKLDDSRRAKMSPSCHSEATEQTPEIRVQLKDDEHSFCRFSLSEFATDFILRLRDRFHSKAQGVRLISF